MSANVSSVVSSLNPVNGRYIPRDGERTERWYTIMKVAALGVALGLGLLFAPLSIWIGIGVAGFSLFMMGYIATVDTVTDGHTKLQLAIWEENVPKAKFLLFLGANPNTVGERVPPLLDAVSFHDPALSEHLIQAGADVNVITNGSAPIHHAVYFKNDQNVAILLANGANPNIPIRGGNLGGGTAYELALGEQMYFNLGYGHHYRPGDLRTTEQLKAAANRIVELISPNVRA